MTIFDLDTSENLAQYWINLEDKQQYPCEELFPDVQQKGVTIKYILGAHNKPAVLNTSAYDAKAVPRGRVGFDKLMGDMPYFKESKRVDEEMRQELNLIVATGNDALIDTVVVNIFDDKIDLLKGAKATKEMLRMMALTTGYVDIISGGQVFHFDYMVDHKGTSEKDWSDPEADIIEDIRVAKEQIRLDTGADVERAMCDSKVLKNMRYNNKIRKSILPLTNGVGTITDAKIKQFFKDEMELSIYVNDLAYQGNDGTTKFMPSDTFVMFPAGVLGQTKMGTTPDESDLKTSGIANVAIVDSGVAITSIQSANPVQVETVVSMICLPSFQLAHQVYIMDTTGKKASE